MARMARCRDGERGPVFRPADESTLSPSLAKNREKLLINSINGFLLFEKVLKIMSVFRKFCTF